jgi:hypothetical protein
MYSLFYFLIKSKKRYIDLGKLPEHHGILKKWIFSLIAIQSFISLYTFLDTLSGLGPWGQFGIFTYQNYFRFLGGAFFIQNVLLFLFPKILFDTFSYPNDYQTTILNLKTELSQKS